MGKLLGKTIPDKLEDILRDKNAAKLFRAHLDSSLCAENYDFYVVVPRVKTVLDAKVLFEEFISNEARRPINISYHHRTAASQLMEDPDPDKTLGAWKKLLAELRTEVFNLMTLNFRSRYLQDDAFYNYYVKPAKPAIVAKKLGVKTKEGKVKVAEAMHRCARGDVKEAEKFGVQLFNDKKEKYFQLNPREFVAAIWSGKFKKQMENAGTDTKEEVRKAASSARVTPSQIKSLCKWLDIKKFQNNDTPNSIKKIYGLLGEGNVSDAKKEYVKNVQRREPGLQDDKDKALDWALFLIAMKRAKIVK